ncbi:MAG: ferritin [Planctomycetaceae bacterium]
MKTVAADIFVKLNDQINKELTAWYEYLAMSSWCSAHYFNGFASWLNSQAQEEYAHAARLRTFLLERGAQVELKALAEPRTDYESVLEIFEAALKQEEQNTQSINQIYQFAFENRAFASIPELQWFITEQVEEERTAQINLAHIRMVKNDPAALLISIEPLGGASPVVSGSH